MTQTPSVLVHGKFRYDLQPLGDFTQKEANQLKKELEKHLVTIYLTEIEVPPKKDIPAFCPYKPSNRYWTGKILGFLKQQNQESDFVTIGLTHRDISTSIHGNDNYGIVGLLFHPGNACVVSTFRLKRRDVLWKVTTHEFLHSRGLPIAKRIIQSAWWKMPLKRILSTWKTDRAKIAKTHWKASLTINEWPK